MLPVQIYIIIGTLLVTTVCILLIHFWIRAGKLKAAQEARDRMIADVNKTAIENAIKQRIAERTAAIQAGKVREETKQDLDKGELSYFDKHPFS
jgi:hypothetical protein